MPVWSRKSSSRSSEWSNRSSESGHNPRPPGKMHRNLSIRSGKTGGGTGSSSGGGGGGSHRVGFSLSSLRGSIQPELSRKLYKLIKTSNNVVGAHESAGRERVSIATQLSEWGEQTGDEAISDVSDKVGVILSEIGEQEDNYAHALDDARGVMKQIRNTEKSVQPSRDGKRKIADEIAKIKSKEPESARLVVLEQELVRAEAENLVAEAQLTNITRQKLRESYEAEFLATIERAEKQIILARHGRRLLQLLEGGAVVPGDERQPYTHSAQARQILNDAEDDLRDWQADPEDQYLGSHQHEMAHDQKQPVQLSSPTISSGGELSPREATHGGTAQNISGNTGGEVANTTSTAQPQAAQQKEEYKPRSLEIKLWE
ncbi:putative sphingolipid long chain base-responsive protein lsp1 [Diaporthe ampelina]|uniref:Putative sphingolipid long chain base-responsive protein lsp1 n=1 Tax=Diaporthe ampelina TaxID=1214573 RepID=A0A0G2FJ65_9PEZI|nr:putative sphingolipid long chain base-responsive protein lsp1 [Diaporthe ampelina]